MPVEYYTPSKEELLAAIRKEFTFLESEYDYVELTDRPERYVNPYSILYRRSPVEVLIEGISYGFGVTIEFRVRDHLADTPRAQFSAGWLCSLRRPNPQEPTFPDKRGQLIQLPRLAKELRAVADDFLRGDLSVLPQVTAAISNARADAELASKVHDFRRAEARSQNSFRSGDYASVVQELEPYRDLLNPSSRKRLEIAKSRA
jgi:hypothetical protein